NGIPDDFRVLLRGTALTAYEVFHDIPVIGYPVHKAFDIPPLFRKRLMIQYISCSVYILAVYELRRNRAAFMCLSFHLVYIPVRSKITGIDYPYIRTVFFHFLGIP